MSSAPNAGGGGPVIGRTRPTDEKLSVPSSAIAAGSGADGGRLGEVIEATPPMGVVVGRFGREISSSGIRSVSFARFRASRPASAAAARRLELGSAVIGGGGIDAAPGGVDGRGKDAAPGGVDGRSGAFARSGGGDDGFSAMGGGASTPSSSPRMMSSSGSAWGAASA
ncbi:MAG: hypothetical protein BGO98_06685 [Myxococcales bacterium 68-20]|nr:MAG: hypothetical protein BGO98_06685 [Myxococcales bacterium 68-20]